MKAKVVRPCYQNTSDYQQDFLQEDFKKSKPSWIVFSYFDCFSIGAT